MIRTLFLGLVALLCLGCQEIQVQRKSNLLVSTVPDLYEQEVLDNLVRTCANEGAIPFFATPTQGTNQQTRQLQFSETTGLSLITNAAASISNLLGGFLVSSQQFAVAPQVQYQQSFQLAPLIDANKLSLLSIAFRMALGNQVTNLDAFRLGKFFNDQKTVFAPDHYRAITGQELPLRAMFDAGIKEGAASLIFPVQPRPWIHIETRKKDVPRGVCLCSHWCGYWIWVGPADVAQLSAFTLAILDIAAAAPSGDGVTKVELSIGTKIAGTLDNQPIELNGKPPAEEPPEQLKFPPDPKIGAVPHIDTTSPTFRGTVTQFPFSSPPP